MSRFPGGNNVMLVHGLFCRIKRLFTPATLGRAEAAPAPRWLCFAKTFPLGEVPRLDRAQSASHAQVQDWIRSQSRSGETRPRVSLPSPGAALERCGDSWATSGARVV